MGESSIELPWQRIVAQVRQRREDKIQTEWRIPASLLPASDMHFVHDFPKKSGLFSARELEITDTSASEIVTKIAQGEWNALDVTTAFCKRAAVAHQLVNCLTEIDFERAFRRANELDNFYKKEGKTVGPLHGLPISLKDQIHLKGLDSTIGYVSYANKPAPEDSTIVTLLLRAGAVPYVKTNIPTALIMEECINNLYGRTLLPYNRALSSGGSTGGGAALISLGGSVIEVGSDIGGSIRQPASYNGLYGLRPSHGRLPYNNALTVLRGLVNLRCVFGPLARHPEDIRLFMASVADEAPWRADPDVLPLPWRKELETLPEKMCFGIARMGDDDGHGRDDASLHGRVTPTPPVLRAMDIVETALRAAGHTVINYPVAAENSEAVAIGYAMVVADGGEEVRGDGEGEPLPTKTEGLFGHSNKELQPLSTAQVRQVQQRRDRLAQRWLDRWEASRALTDTGRPIDALIMPNTTCAGLRHDTPFFHYTGLLTPVLDVTSAAFPVTAVDLEADVYPDEWVPLSAADEQEHKVYGTPSNYENCQVGLSVVGGRLEEEKVTAILHMLRDVVGYRP